MTTHLSPHVVYRLYDASDTLLYIGVSSDFFQRLESHRRQSPFGPHVASYTLAYFATRAEADYAERVAILAEPTTGNSTVKVKRKLPPGPPPVPLGMSERRACLRVEVPPETMAVLVGRAAGYRLTVEQYAAELLIAADDWRE